MTHHIADQFEDIALVHDLITRREKANRGRLCFQREKLSYYSCWCRRAGPNGSDLPCPGAELPFSGDLA